ncbi:BMP family ABC transporter substrate-binding protein [Natronococcus pandeyae]|uniref:BMP family ABC transporter substrate-binding protein n=1 Tax=Natronococcus pandeyae TaxID=2055836 RepID=A0A8J8Q5I3_9EURY|nr:BMP family protein [Natronococcus pandeyae]TYL39334.1 BMP family ABC transporter substrate-binding protein [Natronococcus pandeyae]
MVRDRRTFLYSTGVAGLAALAGCVGGFDEGGEGEDSNVGMVYATGGLGDDSFNDMAQQGVLQAEEEFGVSFDEAEPDSVGEFDGAQRSFADSGDYDLVSCIGFAQEDALVGNAEEYPDQNFMIVDTVVEADNVRSYVFDEPAGSFLVGTLAGLLTDTEFAAGDGETNPDESVVGFVGGAESPLIESFHAGFEAGVEHANPDAEVLSSYVGDFNDTAGGQETARSMYESGADVVFHAAGRTGIGVFQAAESEGRFAIGVDDDQSVSQEDYADVILSSMVKRVDEAVFTAIESVIDDAFEGGEVEELGLEDDAVENVYGESIGDEIPDEITEEVESTRQQIIDGEIEVPDEL